MNQCCRKLVCNSALREPNLTISAGSRVHGSATPILLARALPLYISVVGVPITRTKLLLVLLFTFSAQLIYVLSAHNHVCVCFTARSTFDVPLVILAVNCGSLETVQYFTSELGLGRSDRDDKGRDAITVAMEAQQFEIAQALSRAFGYLL